MTYEDRAKALCDWCNSPEGVAELSRRNGVLSDRYVFVPEIAAAIREAVIEEREACAKAVETFLDGHLLAMREEAAFERAAEAIRGRGKV